MSPIEPPQSQSPKTIQLVALDRDETVIPTMSIEVTAPASPDHRVDEYRYIVEGVRVTREAFHEIAMLSRLAFDIGQARGA